MASLTGLPPLPRSLHGLWEAGRRQWQETERRLMIKASIQQDLQHRHSNGYHRQERPTTRSLQAAIAHLRREMVSLRQLDMSLLCQLWSLNEGLLDLKASHNEPHIEADQSLDCSGDEGASLAEVEEEDGDYLVPEDGSSWLAQSLLGEASMRSSAADSVLEAAIEDSERQHSYHRSASLQRPHSYTPGDMSAGSQHN